MLRLLGSKTMLCFWAILIPRETGHISFRGASSSGFRALELWHGQVSFMAAWKYGQINLP